MKIKKLVFIILLGFGLQFVPITVNGALGIPCATSKQDPAVQKERIAEYLKQHPEATLEKATKATEMCNFNDIFRLINNIITFVLKDILLPITIVLITYAGWLFMTSGASENKRSKAKNLFKNLVIGIAMILCSWLIIYLLFRAFGYDTSRGRAGLSDQTINWNTNNTGAAVLAQNNTASSNSANSVNKNTKYAASLVVNLSRPSNSVATINITPKNNTKINIGIRLSCMPTDLITQELGSSAEGVIRPGSGTVSLNLKLLEDTSYSCSIESDQGFISFADPTDANIKTPAGPNSTQSVFSIVSSNIKNNELISIAYRNASSLDFDAGFLYCKDSINGNTIINQSGALIDRSKGSDLRYLNYNLPIGLSNTIAQDTNLDCDLSTFKSDKGVIKESKNNFSLLLRSTKDNTQLASVFRVAEINTRANSIIVLFNGSVNIDPNMDLVCVSNGSNHIMRAKVSFDPTQVSRINGTTVPKPTDGTVNSPISLPVVWNGYGLRPNAIYICELKGKTLRNISGYADQNIVNRQVVFNLNTPDIPLIKNPESKLSYYVSIRPPQVLYTKYPLLKSTTLNPNSQYVSPSIFKQAIPDAMFVPVVNGSVVDNGRMNLSCNNILGPSMGTSWLKTVAVSGDISYVVGLSRLYGRNESSYSSGAGFTIPITRDPQSGFMHSSVYDCFAGFTVENIPQIRAFTVAVPLYVDPTEIGPVVLAAESVNANKNYATFTIVASPRLENSVNYSCRNVNGSYSDAVYWPPQALGIRMPVAIPISTTIPGLKPGLMYNCELNGTTFQKEKVNYQFNIQTP
jgi:hypothetical protein